MTSSLAFEFLTYSIPLRADPLTSGYRPCMQMLPPDSLFSIRCSSMDNYGERALVCCGDIALACFQLRYHLALQSLVTILRHVSMCRMVKPPHLLLSQVVFAGRPSVLTSSSTPHIMIFTVVWIKLACHMVVVNKRTQPLLSHLVRKVGKTSIQPLAGPTT